MKLVKWAKSLCNTRCGTMSMARWSSGGQVLNYSVSYGLVPLAAIAGKTRTMPDEFINSEEDGLTTAFDNYCRPLIGSSVPEPHRLRAPRVLRCPTDPRAIAGAPRGSFTASCRPGEGCVLLIGVLKLTETLPFI